MAATPNGASDLGIRDVVSKRARKVVREVLDIIASPAALDSIPAALKQFGMLGESPIPAFAEVAVTGTPEERLFAAAMIFTVSKQVAGSVPPEAVAYCIELFKKFLMGDNREAQWTACLLLARFGAPRELSPFLLKLLDSPNHGLSALAAAALLPDESVEDPNIARSLTRAIFTDDDGLVSGIAGSALLRMDVHLDAVQYQIRERLPRMNDRCQHCILITIKQLGSEAHGLFDVVKEILEDGDKPPAIRRVAASALGGIAAGSGKAKPFLMRAIGSPAWQVVDGAVEGLRLNGSFPVEAIARLTELLSHRNKEMRSTAALGLSQLGERAVAALPTLLQRLGEEPDVEILSLLTSVLSNIGQAAIPGLTKIIIEGDRFRAESAMKALSGIGIDAGQTLAELIRDTENDLIRKMLVGVLVQMNRGAVCAVPVLADILDETDDDELAVYCALAICLCGASATEAIPALIRRIARCGTDDEVGTIAEKSLYTMRSTATVSLQRAIEQSDGSMRDRLQNALVKLDVSSASNLGRLEAYDRDDLLAAFVDVGGVLETHGPTAWGRIAIILKEKEGQGLLTPGYIGVSESAIHKHMKALIAIVGPGLTEQRRNAKGGLTDKGRALLVEAKEYLQRKALHRERHAK